MPSDNNDLHGNSNAADWAERFCQVVAEKPEIASDPGAMLAWFAGAIESGRMARAAENMDAVESAIESAEQMIGEANGHDNTGLVYAGIAQARASMALADVMLFTARSHR